MVSDSVAGEMGREGAQFLALQNSPLVGGLGLRRVVIFPFRPKVVSVLLEGPVYHLCGETSWAECEHTADGLRP